MAFCAATRTIEVLLAGVDIACLQVGNFDTASAALHGCRGHLASADEGHKAIQLLAGELKRRHLLVRLVPPIVHNLRDLGSILILKNELGLRKVWPGLAAHCVAAMTECAVLQEERAAGSRLTRELRTAMIPLASGSRKRCEHRCRAKIVEQGGQLFTRQGREAGHAPFAFVNEFDDLRVGHLPLDADQRRKRRQNAFALVAVADRATFRIRCSTSLILG